MFRLAFFSTFCFPRGEGSFYSQGPFLGVITLPIYYLPSAKRNHPSGSGFIIKL